MSGDRVSVLSTPLALYDCVEPWTVDQLHSIEIHTVNLAGAEDGYDMDVVQLGGRLSFPLKSYHGGR